MTPVGRAPLAVDDPVLRDFAVEVGDTGPVVARGNRTRWEVGGPVDPSAREVAAPRGIVDYVPAEMTVRVRAGTTVDELHEKLAEQGQRTALPERGGTVGGAVAVGEDDLRRRGRGTVAASVLQVRYVSAEGDLISGGGPTVKNVTGYDLPRLLVGSMGTLGLLGEVTLRTNPRPAVSQWLRSDDADPFAAAERVLRPGAALWNGTSVWLELEGHEGDVATDQSTLAALGRWEAVAGPPERGPCRWSLAPGELRRLDPSVGDLASSTGAFVASIGVGTIWAAQPAPVRRMTPEVAAVAHRLKTNFDPTGRLAPGRGLGRP